MAIPTPTIPSAVQTVSAVALKPTQNNKAFYIYSGIIDVGTSETTMISINDIGKRDVLFCCEVGVDSTSSADLTLTVKSNGSTIFINKFDNQGSIYGADTPSLKFILPANTSIEVTLKSASSSFDMTVAGYGYYMEQMNYGTT
jgi:hypothetical protein